MLVRRRFDRFDKDGSGSIDAGELSILCSSLGRDLDSEALREALAKLDANGNGKLERAEFQGWWEVGLSMDALHNEEAKQAKIDRARTLKRQVTRARLDPQPQPGSQCPRASLGRRRTRACSARSCS